MKEDATAKELEHLLRDALNTGLESPRGGTPILQLKTVPLQVQHLPKQHLPTQAKKATAEAADAAPKSETQLAAKPTLDSVPPAAPKVAGSTTAKRSSLPALLAVGAFALAAAGGAAWLARQHRPPVAIMETATPDSTQVASGEGAVGISLKARPAKGIAEPPKAVDPTPTTTAATPPPPPTFNTNADPPKLAMAKPAEVKPADPKPEAAEAKPKHEPKAHASSAPAAAAPKVEPKPEKTTDNPTAPTSPPAGSVDALLQQQLKGAIP